jgi:hypothetical protein
MGPASAVRARAAQWLLDVRARRGRLRCRAWIRGAFAASARATALRSRRSPARPGAYVADGSLLPRALGVNPMITIIAMARRVARGLADQLSG